MDAAVGADVLAPGFLASGQRRQQAPEQHVFSQAGEFGVDLGDGLEQCGINLWLLGLFGAPLWRPAARFEQGTDLFARAQFDAGELLL